MSATLAALDNASSGLVMAVSGAVIALVPKIFSWINSKLHGDRVLLLRQTLDNQAIIYVTDMEEHGWGVDQAINELATYVREISLPNTIKQLGLTESQIEEMARAAFLRVYQNRPVPREPRG